MTILAIETLRGPVIELIDGDAPVLEISEVGVQGAAGGQTPPGVFTQAAASAEWIVNHNLGWKPFVTLLSPGSVEVEANVVHFSDNQFRVFFSQPQSGLALMR
jgi:hypothetical protein